MRFLASRKCAVCLWHVLRHGIALLLAFAAGLKLVVWLWPALGRAENGGLGLIGVVAECLLAFWLCWGVYTSAAWFTCLAAFTAFAAVALARLLGGQSSCGCFGPLVVHPAWTLTIDLLLVALLLLVRPAVMPWGEAEMPRGEVVISRRRACWLRRIAASLAAATALLLPLGVAAHRSSRSAALIESGLASSRGMDVSQGVASSWGVASSQGMVLLEPAQWVGRPLPILRFIDIHQQLLQGQWRVILVHHGCGKCEAIVRKRLSAGSAAPFTAFVQVPPLGPVAEAARHGVAWGALSDEFEWIVETPLEIVVDAGRVIQVREL